MIGPFRFRKRNLWRKIAGVVYMLSARFTHLETASQSVGERRPMVERIADWEVWQDRRKAEGRRSPAVFQSAKR